MKAPTREELIHALLDAQPVSFAHRLDIPVENASDDSLFRLLRVALLYQDDVPVETFGRIETIFRENNWNVPQNLYKSTFQERVNALESADYIVFDQRETHARWLGEMAEAVMFRYAGGLGTLRRSAYRDPQTERELLRGFGGMDDRRVDLFCREVQVAWCEHFPFLANKGLAAAIKLGIAESVDDLSLQVANLDFPRLAWALEQVAKEDRYDEVRRAAVEPSLARR